MTTTRSFKAYSPGSKSPDLLAPANTHNLASSLILSTITNVGECLFRKTLAFLSFQSSQTVSKVREANALRWGVGPSAKLLHHSLMLRSDHNLGWMPWRPSHSLRISQILIEKRQLTKRWSTDSVVCLQSGQAPQFGHPRFCNLSAVQSPFWRASHTW
jgi:hypothetical protein